MQLESNEWMTKEGEVLTPKQMETSHLVNILNMLARRAQSFLGARANLLMIAGRYEEAREVAELALDNEKLRQWCLQRYTITRHIERELMRRSVSVDFGLYY